MRRATSTYPAQDPAGCATSSQTCCSKCVSCYDDVNAMLLLQCIYILQSRSKCQANHDELLTVRNRMLKSVYACTMRMFCRVANGIGQAMGKVPGQRHRHALAALGAHAADNGMDGCHRGRAVCSQHAGRAAAHGRRKSTGKLDRTQCCLYAA